MIAEFKKITAKLFKDRGAPGQRKKITIILVSIVGLYLAVLVCSFLANKPPQKEAVKTGDESSGMFVSAGPSTNECSVVAKVLSVQEKRYDDVTVLVQKLPRQGVSKIFFQLQILRAEGPAWWRQTAGNDEASRMCKAGQIVDAYAYRETDVMGTQPFSKFEKIKCTIMALPVSSEGFYYKVSKVRRY